VGEGKFKKPLEDLWRRVENGCDLGVNRQSRRRQKGFKRAIGGKHVEVMSPDTEKTLVGTFMKAGPTIRQLRKAHKWRGRVEEKSFVVAGVGGRDTRIQRGDKKKGECGGTTDLTCQIATENLRLWRENGKNLGGFDVAGEISWGRGRTPIYCLNREDEIADGCGRKVS